MASGLHPRMKEKRKSPRSEMLLLRMMWRWAPIVPKVPEKLMKRTIRGMLEYTQRMGEAALDRIRCYNAVPQEFAAAKKISVAKVITTRTIKLSELAKII